MNTPYTSFCAKCGEPVRLTASGWGHAEALPRFRMDDEWRTLDCPSCGGSGLVWNDWSGADECSDCCAGRLWIRPSGHTFMYPGGPAQGMWSREEYEKGHPEPSYNDTPLGLEDNHAGTPSSREEVET